MESEDIGMEKNVLLFVTQELEGHKSIYFKHSQVKRHLKFLHLLYN